MGAIMLIAPTQTMPLTLSLPTARMRLCYEEDCKKDPLSIRTKVDRANLVHCSTTAM